MSAKAGPASGKTIILVPIYQADPSALERYSLEYSLARLGRHELAFIGPAGLDLKYYKERFPERPFIGCDPSYFASIKGYNLLLLSADFYERFQGSHEFMLILQTDAIVLRDELAHWEQQPYDYVGAPWPDGVEILVNLDRFGAVGGKKVRAHVGNGGFSLRRIRPCVELLKEFPQARETFWRTGSSEDLFFSIMGELSTGFVMPGEMTASHFAMELQPQRYLAMNGGRDPMAGHAWWKYDPWFWAERFEGVVPFRFPPKPQPAAAAAAPAA
jgi:hypothetical protein